MNILRIILAIFTLNALYANENIEAGIQSPTGDVVVPVAGHAPQEVASRSQAIRERVSTLFQQATECCWPRRTETELMVSRTLAPVRNRAIGIAGLNVLHAFVEGNRQSEQNLGPQGRRLNVEDINQEHIERIAIGSLHQAFAGLEETINSQYTQEVRDAADEFLRTHR